jgi:hypothetical protein
MFQYHVVLNVTTAHQKVSGIELNHVAFHHFCSNRYANVENIVRIISITNIAVKYSILFLIIHFQIFLTMGILSTSSYILKTLNILNSTKIQYDQYQYNAINTKNGKNDNKSNKFIILKGNSFL